MQTALVADQEELGHASGEIFSYGFLRTLSSMHTYSVRTNTNTPTHPSIPPSIQCMVIATICRVNAAVIVLFLLFNRTMSAVLQQCWVCYFAGVFSSLSSSSSFVK